jgi:hypothetical protein
MTEEVSMQPYVVVVFAALALGLNACVTPPLPPQAIVQNCQQFTQDITAAGKSVPGYGVQCQQPDGSWGVTVPPQATPPLASAVVPAPAYPYPYQVPDYSYPYVYPYGGAYSLYPWYYGPDVYLGFGWGGGWGWYGHGGGWHDGGWHGGGWSGGGGHWHGENGGHH